MAEAFISSQISHLAPNLILKAVPTCCILLGFLTNTRRKHWRALKSWGRSIMLAPEARKASCRLFTLLHTWESHPRNTSPQQRTIQELLVEQLSFPSCSPGDEFGKYRGYMEVMRPVRTDFWPNQSKTATCARRDGERVEEDTRALWDLYYLPQQEPMLNFKDLVTSDVFWSCQPVAVGYLT